MSLQLDSAAYLTNSADPDWTGTGSIFLRLYPSFAINDGSDHCFYIKQRFPFSLHFFIMVKASDNLLYVGFYDSGEQRLSLAASAALTTSTFANHVFTWDTGAPNQEYYVDNVLKASSASAFTVPTITTMVRFGAAENAGAVQPASAFFAEHGRWNRVLTAGERQALQATGCPLFAPNGLVEYHPMTAATGAGRDLMGTTDLTVSGSPAQGGTPYRIRPEAGYMQAQMAAVPGVSPPAVSNPFQVFAPTVVIEGAIVPPVVSNPFQVYAPALSFTGEQTIDVPLVSSAFTVYAPAVNVSESTIQEDVRELEPHNLKVRIVDFVGGDDLRITRTYTELQGGISISKAYLTIKRYAKDDNDVSAIVQKTITSSMQVSGEITDNDTTGGSIGMYFDLSKDDTSLLTPLIPYHYDVQVITIGNAVYTCEKGVIVMQQGVTHANN